MYRNLPFTLLPLAMIAVAVSANGQDAQIKGRVLDGSGAVVPRAQVRIVELQTGATRSTQTNGSGQYVSAALSPGSYQVTVEADGFKTVVSEPITLYVSQAAVFDVRLSVGATSSEIVVHASSADVNTTDATVSTVIDGNFVNEIPLNGRSFQPLVLATPGVVSASPQGGDVGDFSVNGLRTNANSYIVDGVSANNGVAQFSGSNTSGMSSNATILGTTQSILPVDALQEFRISSSTYTAEFGRQPGAQISFLSRSGSNAYHGEGYDYLRNTVFDANDWFDTYHTPAIPRQPERQNDFGGVLSGPLSVPKLYSAANRAFFFFAYEGLRLTQPQAAFIYWVPSNGTYSTATYSNPKLKNVRANTPAALLPVVNAYPLPNCLQSQDPQCVDYASGMSPYIQTGSQVSPANTISARVDAQAFPGTKVFARYGDTTSRLTAALTTGPDTNDTMVRTRVYLLGADSAVRATLSNELRLQYSPASILLSQNPSAAGGAVPVNLQTLQGLPAVGGESFVEFVEPGNGTDNKIYSADTGNLQFQRNAVDNLGWTYKTHLFKVGVDYRQTTTYLNDGRWSRSPGAYTYYKNPTEILSNLPDKIRTFHNLRQDPTTKNFGLFFQDSWRILPRLSLSAGLRWDLNPPPTISGAQQYSITGDPGVAGSLALSALGAPLYKTTYTNFEPRFGLALVLHKQPGNETVLRAGSGLYHDLISLTSVIGSDDSIGAGSTAMVGTTYGTATPFPVAASVILAPIVNPPQPPYGAAYFADPNLHPPTVLHWNISLEQGLGQRQSFDLAYVGTQGRDLVDLEEYDVSLTNPNFTAVNVVQNGPGSIYNSFQAQYKRRMLHGLQLQAAYTWAHAIDWSSTDSQSGLPIQRGNSSHDIRNKFTSLLLYQFPARYPSILERQILGGWSLSAIVVARSAFPVHVSGATIFDPISGTEYSVRLDYNGQNPYLHVPGIPGGREFNGAAFSVPTVSEGTNGNVPRNFLRGFGEVQADTALQREFSIHDQIRLLFRTEAFNVLNHPTFGAVNGTCGATAAGAVCNNPLFGQATNSLAQAVGGLSPIYQQGGPRSLQFALKLRF